MSSSRLRLPYAGLLIVAIGIAFFRPASGSQATTLNLSQDLVALGIAGSNMVPNQPALDAGPLFMAGVAYAKNHGITLVVADPGTYYFLSTVDNTHAAVARIDNMTIDFHGASLIFTHPLYYGLVVYGSTNATVQNLTADFQPLPFTQLRVAAVDVPSSQIQYTVEPGYQHPSAFNSLTGWRGQEPHSIEVLVFRNGQPASGTRRMLTARPFSGDRLSLMSFTAPATVDAIRPGDTAVVRLRAFGSDAVNTNHCTGCTLRNITVYTTASGGAAVGMIASRSNVLERVYVMPKPGTDRLISTTSAIFVGVAGLGSRIRLSRGIRTTDDAFWFYGRVVGTVQSQPGNTSLVVSPATAWTVLGDGDSVPNGSPVTFQRISDGVVIASAVIVSQSAPASQPPQVTYVFDRNLPAAVLDTVMYTTDASQNGHNSILERSTVQNQSACCKGTYFAGLANSSVRGNYIQRSGFAGVFLLQAMTPGDPPNPPLVNMTVARNVIDGTNITSDWWWFELGAIQSVTLTTAFDLMATAPFSNLSVTNNFIADSGRSAVWLGNTNGGSVTGNYILSPNARPDLANANPAKLADALLPLVVDTTSSGIITAGNTIDLTSRRLAVTDAQYRELAAYAPGGAARLSAYNIGTVASPTVTLTDADGSTSPLTVQPSGPHALDVGVPTGAALGGAFVTLTSGGAKYFATLFLDSQDHIPAVNGCTFQSSVSSIPVPGVASTVPILVVTQAGCGYQVVSKSAFVTAGGSGTGTGVVSVDFAANGGVARTATIEIAGQPLAIEQSAGGDPTAPTGLQAAVTGTTVRLSWAAPAQGTPTSYVIAAGSSPGASNLATFDTGHSATVFTTAAPLGTYHVRVRARNGSVIGGPSNEVVVNVTGTCTAPPTPGGLTHTINGSSVQLAWQAAAGATSYVLEAGSTSGSNNLLVSDTGNVTTLGATAAPGTYFVRIRARNACGSSAPSNEVVVVVAGCAPTLAPASAAGTVTNGTVQVSWGAVTGATGYQVEAGLSPGATNAGVFQISGTSIAGAAPPGRYYVRIRARNGCGVGPASSEIVIDVPPFAA
jgi:hypothetical protein